MLCKTCRQNTTGGYAGLDFKEYGSCFSDVCALYQPGFWEVFKVSSKKASTILIFEVIKKRVAIQGSVKKTCSAVLQVNKKSSCDCCCCFKGFLTSLSPIFKTSSEAALNITPICLR